MATFHYDIKPSNVQLIRRLSMDSYIVRVYAGPLSEEVECACVEVQKSATSEDVIAMACRKLRLGGTDVRRQYELAEVFSSGGQLCKERRLDSTEHPVALQLLWPKVASSSSSSQAGVNAGGLFDGYRFYLRRRETVSGIEGWLVQDQSAVDSFLLSFLTQPLAGREYPDLCSLPDLNERTLLHNLKVRFSQRNIYTYVGTILIAVNPFKFFPIYNPKYVSMYQNKRLGDLPPHIFAVADAAYHSMLRQKQNQCIVISGESGSGKTESTNLLLHHLTALSHKGLHGSGVEQTLLGAGPVLEAFGNAKTIHNNNSSRFGKFIQVNYKQNGMVHGAVVEKYLLEKSRIVSQARGERNYHVFYYLLAGADDQEKQLLDLTTTDQYNYLAKGHVEDTSSENIDSTDGLDEQHEFARLKQSMEMVGFSHETQRKIFSVLSAVLHLGNIEFKKKGDKHHDESVIIKNIATVETISKLLKVKQKFVVEALTQKRSTAGDETFVINYKMDDAIATRDAMAKCIYGALFDWIVLKVNQALLAKKHDSEHEGDSIGVLDIFGFEDFGRNSFEQFCINYANEHLQYYFNQHIFRFEQEEYQREGIHWKNIEFIDNTGSLELFSKRPGGLFCLLDEECSFPGATNETLLIKFTQHQKGNLYYQVSQLKEGAFSIMHYAGKVKYFAKDFREKNVDLVRPEIVSTLKRSNLTFVRELMGFDPVAVLRWSVVRAFFRCISAFLKAGKTHSRKEGKDICRRPHKPAEPTTSSIFNEVLLNHEREARLKQVGSLLHQKEVVHQELLLYTGLENSLSRDEVLSIHKAHKILMRNKSFKPKSRPPFSFHDIKALKAIANRSIGGNARGTGNKKQQPPTVGAQFQWSLARLMTTLNQANPFFIRCIKSNKEKAPCVFDEELVMRQLRYTGMLATVKIRQSGYNYRLSFEEFVSVYKILLPRKQQHSKEDIRKFLNSMGLQQENYQIGVNKIFLRESEKMRLDESLHSAIMKRVITIQRCLKTSLERKAYLRLKEATILIQTHIRCFLAQRDFHYKSAVTIMLQTHIRAHLVRRKFLAHRAAVVYIQAYIKSVLMRRRFFILREEYYAMLKREEEDRKAQEILDKERQQWEKDQEVDRIKEDAERKQELIQRRDKFIRDRNLTDGILSNHRRQRKEEMQSTASDEGVLVKASSMEEFEDKEDHFLPRRDSEESSGIMDESDTETTSRFTADTPPPTPPSHRHKTFQLSNQVKARDVIIHKGNYPKRQRKSPAPLAKQESFSDVESCPTTPDHLADSTSNIPAQLDLARPTLQNKDLLRRREEVADWEHDGGHLSPLHKAKKHWRNWVGGTRKKKDDSDEESEDSSVQYQSTSEATVVASDRHGQTTNAAGGTKRAKKKLRPGASKTASTCVAETPLQPSSNMKVARSMEWQYADNMVISDVAELSLLDHFISQKQRGFSNDVTGNREDSVFDRIFKGALVKFRIDLKSIIGLQIGKEKTTVRYRDLLEQFRQILEAEMKKEKTDAPLVLSVNAFRGFLDEFRKQEEARARDSKRDDRRQHKKTHKREKHKKVPDVVEYHGHRYQQVQFNIPTFCEVCTSLIWIMDKGYVCQDCKLACHKKCYNKHSSTCKALADSRGQPCSQLFGAPLESLVSSSHKVPLVCEKLMSTLERTGMYVEGIYRKSGAAPKVKELKSTLETGVEGVLLEDYQAHVLASVFKLFLRHLPEPLLTCDLFEDFVRATDIKDEKDMVKSLFDIIRKLPRPNFDLFERLCFHLACVAMHCDSNKMTTSALAVIFAPVLLGSNKTLQAQEVIALMPKQMICIEKILNEQIQAIRSKLEDIDILECVEKTAGERLDAVRASLRTVRQKSPRTSPLKQVSHVGDKKEAGEDFDSLTDTDSTCTELVQEEKALTRHIKSLHKEKDKLTHKLFMLESRQGSSDEDVLSDDLDSIIGTDGPSDDYTVSFESLGVLLQHVPETSNCGGQSAPGASEGVSTSQECHYLQLVNPAKDDEIMV